MDDPTTKRIIALVDMDCFYCQVEVRCNPSLKGKPLAVAQSNQWMQGGFVAVNYEARARGVKRFMRGKDAARICPELVVVQSPTVRGRTDLTKYREAGVEVADVFCTFSDCVQRASVDEAFIDLTSIVDERIRNNAVNLSMEKLPSTFVVGYSEPKDNDLSEREKGTERWLKKLASKDTITSPDYRLAVGALIVEEIRAEVERKTQFHCSAGIAHNKILAKLVAGLHKPKCQTILPHEAVPELFEITPVSDVRSLGGKFGKAVVEKLSITNMSELYEFSKKRLQEVFDDKNGAWLYDIARGIDHDPVTPKLISKSIGCCKNFLGKVALKTVDAVAHWLNEMATDIAERLGKDFAENKRRAKLLAVTFTQGETMSRSCALTSYQAKGIFAEAFDLLKKFNQAPDNGSWEPPITHLGLSASKFNAEQTSTIKSFFKTGVNSSEKTKNEPPDDVNHTPSDHTSATDLIEDTESMKRIKKEIPKIKIEPKNSITRFLKNNKIPEKYEDKTKQETKIDVNLTDESDIVKNSYELSKPDTPTENNTNSRFSRSSEEAKLKKCNRIEDSTAENTSGHFNSDVVDFTSEKYIELSRGETSCEFTATKELLEEVQPKRRKVDEPSTSNKEIKSFFETFLAQKTPISESESVSKVEISEPEKTPTTCEGENFRTFDEPSTSTGDNLQEVCPHCDKKINLNIYLDHLDYHAAIDLDKELNGKLQVRTAFISSPKKARSSPQKGRKRKIALKPINQPSIKTFFNQ